MTEWLSEDQEQAWRRFAAVLELLPDVLDAQLRRDADLTHFEYWVLSMLSEAPDRTLRMTFLAERTNASLPRLSHVVSRLEDRGFVKRLPSPSDRRATNAQLTTAGWRKVVKTAPGHLEAVRTHVVDALSAKQIAQLNDISSAILKTLEADVS